MPRRRYFQIDGDQLNEIRLGEEIGEGGEAKVFHLDPLTPRQRQLANQYVAKIYEQSSVYGEGELDPTAKLSLLGSISHAKKKLLKGFFFPKYLICNEKGRCVGFLMPFCHGYSLAELFICFQNQREAIRPLIQPFLRNIDRRWTRVELVTLALDILEKLDSLHQAGILMSDVNTSNILVNENLKSFFIDVDSYQVGNYPCPMYHREYASPRMMAKGCPQGELLNINDENYSIAVLLFQILFVGQHPYARNGKGSLEQSIMERDFAYPLTYDLTKDIPGGGPWQNIWFSLPHEIKKAFYNVFAKGGNYPKTRKWIRLLKDYKKALVNNTIKREIFPMQTAILCQDNTFLGYEMTEPDPSCLTSLRCFDTVIREDAPSRQLLFVEFGSDEIRSWKKDKNGQWNKRPFQTHHFDLLDKNCRMDTDKLVQKWELLNLMPSIKNIEPPITDVRAFGGGCLRNLLNRDEVVDTLKQVIGLNFGVLTFEEEATCLVDAVLQKHPIEEHETMMLIDVGGFATSVITRNSCGDLLRRFLPRLGSLTLVNWLFSTYTGDHPTKVVFKQHDDIVEEVVKSEKFDIIPHCLVGTGALSYLIPQGQMQKTLTLEEIEKESERLRESLISNRRSIIKLGMDYKTDDDFARTTACRLALPVYSSIMRLLGIHQIHVLKIGLGRAYIHHYLTSINHD